MSFIHYEKEIMHNYGFDYELTTMKVYKAILREKMRKISRKITILRLVSSYFISRPTTKNATLPTNVIFTINF